MISIIICSANEQYLDDLRINIGETIGCNYEVLAYPNSDGKRGICEVYNQGAKEANFDLLCFVHEDVKILTQNWGNIVAEIFAENPALGLLGVAGGDYKSLAPSSWFNFEVPVDCNGKLYINIIQDHKFSDLGTQHDYSNPKNEQLSRVACIDGVWMCTRKEITKEVKFDETLLKRFDGYDIDYSLAINRRYQVGVTYQILLHHYSEGKFGQQWLRDTLKVHRKWSKFLPLNFAGLKKAEVVQLEKRHFKFFLNKRYREGSTKQELKRIIWHSSKSRIMSLPLFISLFLYIIKLPKKVN